jgi:iron-sulfur cluster repair protein YtfE (RIC family)
MADVVAEMAPSEIRKLILDGHTQLRTTIAALESLVAKQLKTAPAKKNEELLTHATRFNAEFLAHLKLEEGILRPVLMEIDAWGPVRVERIDKKHTEQRARILEIQAIIIQAQWSELHTELHSFIQELTEDMAAEEKEMLSPDVLRDDVIAVNFSGS